jgi:hypothetical protein
MNKQFAREHYAQQAAIAKATTVFDIVDPSSDINQPVATFVVVDMGRVEREVLKGSIADSDVQKLLPFQTSVAVGRTESHIINESFYDVETNYHIIQRGDAICGRYSPFYRGLGGQPTCPGCLAKGKGIIVNHLYKTCI